MTKKRNTYTREFKIEAVRLLRRSGKTQGQIEEDLGIGSGCLSRWKNEYAEEGEEAFPGQGCLTPEKERIRQLERENEILRQERDILKNGLYIDSWGTGNPKTVDYLCAPTSGGTEPLVARCGRRLEGTGHLPVLTPQIRVDPFLKGVILVHIRRDVKWISR